MLFDYVPRLIAICTSGGLTFVFASMADQYKSLEFALEAIFFAFLAIFALVNLLTWVLKYKMRARDDISSSKRANTDSKQ